MSGWSSGAAVALPVGLAVFCVTPAIGDEAGFRIPDEESCVSSSCHGEMGTKAFVHEAAADGSMCTVCHETTEPGRHEFAPAVPEAQLCGQCHDDLVLGPHKHSPVEEGECTVCHDPHQSDSPKQLVSAGDSLCFFCHEEPDSSDGPVHRPVAEGKCTTCHDPHSSRRSGLLTAYIPELCLACHDRRLEDPQGRVLAPLKAVFESTQLRLHAPFAAGDCLVCHEPHSSGNYRLLVGPHPESIYASFSQGRYVCFNCHDEGAFTEPRTMTETAFRNGNLNLHHRHVNRRKGRTCRSCHQHHAASREALIRDRPPSGDRFINIDAFEKTNTGGSCTPTCHRLMQYDRYDPVPHTLKVTQREGTEATTEELERARREQIRGVEDEPGASRTESADEP